MATRINIMDIFNNLSPETYIWAAAVAKTSSGVGAYIHVKPEYGMIALAKDKSTHDALMLKNGGKFDRWYTITFVPTKKGPGSDLNWRKAVQIDSRFYAKTETEIWELFDEEIQKIIDWHQGKVESAINMGSPLLKMKNTKPHPKKSAYQAVMELKAIFRPAQMNIISQQESELVRNTLEIDVRDDIHLQDLRDIVVMIYSQMSQTNTPTMQAMQIMDTMSAITSVIDSEKIKRGLPT